MSTIGSLMDGYYDFWNEFLYGKITYISRTTPPDCEVKQDVDVSTLKNQIMNILYETSQEINQDVATRQTITVKCGAESAFITEEDMERRKKEYFFNIPKEGTGCVMYGCCPDVNQTAKVTLRAINSSVLDRKVDIKNSIENTIKIRNQVNNCNNNTNVDVKISSETEELMLNAIEELLEKEISMNISSSQNVEVIYNYPQVCVNQCGENNRSSSIDQAINIDALAENIINKTYDIYYNNEYKNDIESTVEIDGTDENESIKKHIYAVITTTLVLVVYILSYTLKSVILLFLLKGAQAPAIVKHCLTLVLIYIIWLLWGVITCLVTKRKPNGVKCSGMNASSNGDCNFWYCAGILQFFMNIALWFADLIFAMAKEFALTIICELDILGLMGGCDEDEEDALEFKYDDDDDQTTTRPLQDGDCIYEPPIKLPASHNTEITCKTSKESEEAGEYKPLAARRRDCINKCIDDTNNILQDIGRGVVIAGATAVTGPVGGLVAGMLIDSGGEAVKEDCTEKCDDECR